MRAPAPTFTGPEPCRLDATEAVALLRRGEISPAELLDAALARIAAVEPAVNAMPTTCPERARAALARLPAADDGPGWLGGLPIGIKDLTEVAGVRTTWGAEGFADYVSTDSDPLVERLEARGGVVVGKTNTPEMGAGGATFNAVFGATRNPWNTGLNAGGSSGGAAVSLATGEVWLSHGSDLAGSLRTPASFCGVVGLRPSPGRAGGGPKAAAFLAEGVQGPMARTVADCALFLDAMAGFDPRQPLSLEAPARPFAAAVERARPDIRVAWTPTQGGFAPVSREMEAVLRAALARVEAAGATVEEACPPLPRLGPTYITLRAFTWAATAGRLPEAVQAQFKRTLRENIQVGRDLTSAQIVDAQRDRTALYHSARRFLERFDVLACPVTGLSPGPVEEEYPTEIDGRPLRDYVEWLRFSFLATVAGLPAISVPVGFAAAGAPVGLQLIGPPRGEAKLLAAARAVEMAADFPKGPIDPIGPARA